jgi:hypothetical protein
VDFEKMGATLEKQQIPTIYDDENFDYKVVKP